MATRPQKEMQKVVQSGGTVVPKGQKAKDAGLPAKEPVKVDEHQVDRW
jgi:hypothetical protein